MLSRTLTRQTAIAIAARRSSRLGTTSTSTAQGANIYLSPPLALIRKPFRQASPTCAHALSTTASSAFYSSSTRGDRKPMASAIDPDTGATSTTSATTTTRGVSTAAAAGGGGEEGGTGNGATGTSAKEEEPEIEPQTETGITPVSLKRSLESSPLEPVYVDVVDMSGGCGQAFQATIVSARFEGKTALARHRLVNGVLREEVRAIHAWTARCLTLGQWEREGERKAR